MRRSHVRTALVAAVAAAGVTGLVTAQLAGAAGTPANKIVAAGSTVEVISPNENVTLLTQTIRATGSGDYIFTASAECAITTTLTTLGNDHSGASGLVKMWVEVDGTPVPVSSDDTTDRGRVVFCNRAETRDTTNFDDEDATIKTFQATKASNSFTWLALNLGQGVHTVTLKGTLEHDATDNASALAAVGKRTLVTNPGHAANDAQISSWGS